VIEACKKINAAIKKAFCREAKGDRTWLSKVRPMMGMIITSIPALNVLADRECKSQPPPSDEGCSAKDFAYWFSEPVLHPRLPTTPPKPRPPITLADLPCRQILIAP
jgi:penicillin-insensitive murein endopeptidase